MTCSICDNEAVVRINDAWFCGDHIDEGFRIISRTIAILQGVPDEELDEVEDRMVGLLDDVQKRWHP
jgi:hypothetical protein